MTMTRIPFTTTWIEQGRILAGSIPQLPEDLAVLKAQGIQVILSLTRRDIETYPNMIQAAYEFGHISFPIPDGGIADDAVMLNAAQVLHESMQRRLPIYVHCRGGIGRTGMILLAYYVLHRGLSLAQAKELVKVRRNYEGNASAIEQGSPQREWIDGLGARQHGDQ